jgi:leucyl aminopeptidase
LLIDATGLSADDLASVLLALRLRLWKQDLYRTTLKDEEKASLEEVIVTNAAEGAQAAWDAATLIAEGVEFTRELVTEPANVLYPKALLNACASALRAPAWTSAFWTKGNARAGHGFPAGRRTGVGASAAPCRAGLARR